MFWLCCRVVSIYDSRCLKKTKSQPVSQLHGHSLSISSAYFSPCTGNRVLTSCMDNHIRWSQLSTFSNCCTYCCWFFNPSSICIFFFFKIFFLTRVGCVRGIHSNHSTTCCPLNLYLKLFIHRIYDTSAMTTNAPLLTSIRYIHSI